MWPCRGVLLQQRPRRGFKSRPGRQFLRESFKCTIVNLKWQKYKYEKFSAAFSTGGGPVAQPGQRTGLLSRESRVQIPPGPLGGGRG